MKLYVAGPMRGYDQFNFPAFQEAAQRLRAAGYEVASPHEGDLAMGFDPTRNSLEAFSMEDAVRRDVEMIIDADGVALLDRWWESKGARAEAAIAGWLDKEARLVNAWVLEALHP